MTVAVTGATGYVGTALVSRLGAAGVTVRALVRDPNAALPAGTERAIVDLSHPSGLDTALAGADAVVHCAAEQRSPSRARHRLVNVRGTHAILQAAAAAGVSRVVHLSSIAVYPRREPGTLVVPDDPLEPFPELRDDYAWSKIGAERWVALYRRAERLDTIALRLGIVYGRGRDFVARVWRRLAGPAAVIAGTARMVVPLVHVDDVVEAVWRALEAPRLGASALNVVGPDSPTQSAYLSHRAAVRGPIRPLYLPLGLAVALSRRRGWRHALARPRGTSRPYALAWVAQEARYDLRATERVLGWSPRIRIEDGLALEANAPQAPVAVAV